MIDITTIFLIFTVLLLWKLCSKPHKYPPGPIRWPIIGNLLSIRGRLIHETACAFSRKYGDVVGLYLGSTPLVIISGLEAVKEAGAKEKLSGRPRTQLALQLGHGCIYGLIFSQGDLWREQRRFSLRHLRDFGFGKHQMEGLIHEEVIVVLKEIDRLAGKGDIPVDFFHLIGTSIVNMLWQIIAGQRYDHGDARLQRLLHLLKELLTQTDASGGIVQNFPFLFKLCPRLTEYNKIVQVRQSVIDFVREDLVRHKETLDHENPRDFMDVYVTEIEKQMKNETYFCEKQLLAICKDLFIAGSDTTFNSITYSLAYMVNYQTVQRKVQEELDCIVGQNRLPSLDDRANLVYTEATLQEVMRMSSVVPLGVPHAPLDSDIQFRGYIIPRNARVLLNISYNHMDPKLWDDPEIFRPERFIDDDGKLLRPEALMPFGTGKRQCLGESLARNNFYLMFTAIMQRYSLVMPPGEQAPSLQPTGGFTIGPKPFQCLMQQRF